MGCALQNESFRDKQTWYYKTPSMGSMIPVEAGWGLVANGCGILPAPRLQVRSKGCTMAL